MKVYHWARDIKMIFQFKGPLIRQLLPSMALIAGMTAVFCFLELTLKVLTIDVSLSLPGLLGAVLGLLLVFRNNTAYDRWWEARKILGGLVNRSRNFALQVKMLMPDSDWDRFNSLQIAFVFALKEHLRGGVKMEELDLLSPEDHKFVSDAQHKPNALAYLLTQEIQDNFKKGEITDFQQLRLLENTDDLIDLLGKCERIRNTPMPVSHTYMLKVLVFVYVVVLPFSLIATLEWWSIMVVTLIYYFMMTVVIIAEEIEDPFGTDDNDLPVDQIAENIRKNVREIYGFRE